MTIKGTLETFNLLDLLQMLSFNQKVGTLVLETVDGPRTLYVESGSFGFVSGDALPSRALARVLRRAGAVPADRLDRGLSITSNSGRFLGDVLAELGVLDSERRNSTWVEAVSELFFDLVQTSIARFEFVEGKALAPDGAEGQAIQPLCGVDGVLIDLTRKMDEWNVLKREVGPEDEVIETTDVAPDLYEMERESPHLASRVLPLVSGRRTIKALVAESDCDRFSVMRMLSTLLKQGAARVVDTDSLVARAEDLLARGAAADAVPLLRRALDRGETPPRTRLRLADALEAAGDERAAAAELDTYAAAAEATDPVGVFEALRSAMRVRGGDAATAARICDLYLRHHARLADRSADALDALRRLVQSASTGGRPLEAAARLSAFVDRGDAPGEDLLVLADLYAAGGHPAEAAGALARRAEEQLVVGRTSAARDLLRRAIAYDATRVDIRRRLGDLDGEDSRRRHRRRLVVLGGMLAVVVGSAGAVYLVYDGRASKSVEEAVGRAEVVTKDAEAQMQKALVAWNKALSVAAGSAPVEGALAGAAAALHAEAERLSNTLRGAREAASMELTSLTASTHGESGAQRLRNIEARQKAILQRADAAVKEAGDRAEKALASGEVAFQEGRFRDAAPLLAQCIALTLDAPARTASARQRLEQVNVYMTAFASAKAEMDEASGKGDTAKAYRLGARIFATFQDSDLTHEVRLPVPVLSTPPGASLRLGHDAIPAATPLVVRYSPFGELDLHLRAPGRVPVAVHLPSYKQVVEAEKASATKPFEISVPLAAGPRWIAAPAEGVSAGPFFVGDAIHVASGDGRRLLTVRASDGTTTDARAFGRTDEKVRLLARDGGGTWMFLGQRTLAFQPDSGGAPWQVHTVGRLDLAPGFDTGFAVLVDETGAAHGIDVASGTVKWRKALSFAPSQPPLASALGFLTCTIGGEAVALSRETGDARALFAPDPAHRAFVAPWGDGVLVLGGAAPGLSMIDASGARSPLAGGASPDLSVHPTLTREGIAWLDAAGVRWLVVGKAHEMVDVAGVGTPAFPVAVANGTVYAVGTDGVLRAARLDAPTVAAWTLRLPSTPRGEPVVHGDLILVRTDAGLAAVER